MLRLSLPSDVPFVFHTFTNGNKFLVVKLKQTSIHVHCIQTGRDSANAQTDVTNSAFQQTEGLIEHRGGIEDFIMINDL